MAPLETPAGPVLVDGKQYSDPPHEYAEVAAQLNGQAMDGFVTAYEKKYKRTKCDGILHHPILPRELVMHTDTWTSRIVVSRLTPGARSRAWLRRLSLGVPLALNVPAVAQDSALSEDPRNLGGATWTVPVELVVRAYRTIHEYPELGKQELATQAFLRKELQDIGYRDFIPSAEAPTAVIAILDTKRPGPVIALRAEMDARRADEPAVHSPRSHRPGLMHNCGHDAHAAMLLEWWLSYL